MVINPQTLRGIYVAFNTIFNKALTEVQPLYTEIASVIPSTTESETYAWLGDIPGMREWIGDREVQNLTASGYVIRNKDFELTVGVDRNAVEDDKLGLYNVSIEFEIFSAKSSYFDWAKIRFTEQFQPEISLARKDPASIELGYNGVMEEVFTGFVARPYNYGGGADEITLKDEMLLLEDTKINNTFLDTTPQEVISYVLAQAGVGKKKLKARGFPTRKKLPIRQMSGVQAINAVNAAWSLKERFFFSGGVFYWGEKPEQQKVYTFEYGVNIINLTRLGGVWELETVSAPFVRHSHKINVIHPKISGEQEVIKVVSSTNDDGFIRTRIYF